MDYRDKMARARGAVDRSNQRISDMLDRVIAKEDEVHKATSGVEQAHHDKMNSQIKDMDSMLHDLAEFSNGGPALDDEPAAVTPVPHVRGYPA